MNVLAGLSGEAWTAVGVVGAALATASSAVTIAWINRSAERRAQPVAAVAERLTTSIGTPNGRGNIVQMLERIDARCERLEHGFDQHMVQNAKDHSSMRDRIETIAGQLIDHRH